MTIQVYACAFSIITNKQCYLLFSKNVLPWEISHTKKEVLNLAIPASLF